MTLRSSIEKDLGDEKAMHVESATNVVEIGPYRVLGLSREDTDFFTNFPAEKRKKVFRKVLSCTCNNIEVCLMCVAID